MNAVEIEEAISDLAEQAFYSASYPYAFLEAEDFTSGETVWLTQLEIAKLFQTTKQNVSLYAKNIFDEAELLPNSVVKESLTVQTDDRRYLRRITKFKRT